MAARERAKAAARTTWQIGIDGPSWQTEYSTQQKAPTVYTAPSKTKLDKNASDTRSLQWEAPDPRRFESEAKAHFTEQSSAASHRFKRTVPPPGFDRGTANKTNYELGLGEPTAYESEGMRQQAHPATRSVAAAPNYRARVDMGQNFDIVTGAGRDIAPKAILRQTADHSFKTTTTNSVYNITKGKQERKVVAPPVQAHAAEKAPLRSLVAVRPPTGSK